MWQRSAKIIKNNLDELFPNQGGYDALRMLGDATNELASGVNNVSTIYELHYNMLLNIISIEKICEQNY